MTLTQVERQIASTILLHVGMNAQRRYFHKRLHNNVPRNMSCHCLFMFSS